MNVKFALNCAIFNIYVSVNFNVNVNVNYITYFIYYGMYLFIFIYENYEQYKLYHLLTAIALPKNLLTIYDNPN